jgi:hypothetical protein
VTIYPQLKVEIAFQADPYASSPTWTDVSKYVRGDVTIKRGRNFELNKNEAGTASLTLENTDGRFSPVNTTPGPTAPYAPYVLPYRPIRITAIADVFGTTYPLFRGYVERWPQKWTDAGNYGTVDITAVDGSKTALSKKFGPRYSDRVAGDGAGVLFHLNEASPALSFFDSITGSAATTNGTVGPAAYQQPGGINGNPDTAVKLAGTTGYILGTQGVQAAFAPGGAVGYGSTEIWVKFDTILTDSTRRTIASGWGGSTFPCVNELAVQFGATAGAARFILRVPTDNVTLGPARATLTGTTAPVAGQWYHLVAVWDERTANTKTATLYVNGVAEATYTGAGSAGVAVAASSGGFILGAFQADGGGAYGNFLAGTLDEFAIYQTQLTASQVAAHYRLAGGSNYAEFASELTSVRVGRLLDSVSWPAALRSIAVGATTMTATGSLDGQDVLTGLQTATAAELGNGFVDASGRYVFQNRAARNSPTSVCTFGEGAGEIPYQEGVTLDFDDTYVLNDVTVTQAGAVPASSAQSIDATSQATYGVRSTTVSVPLQNYSDADGMATTMIAQYKNPVARLSTVPVEIRATPSVIGQVLAREIGELATVKRRPIGAPAISVQAFIDGIEDKISTGAWTRSFQLTPKLANTTY